MLLIQRGGGTDPMKPQQPPQNYENNFAEMVLISAEVRGFSLKAVFFERHLF
jgi:hypothetical protein